MKDPFKSAQRIFKKIIPGSHRSHSPANTDHYLDRQADRPSTQTHTLHAPISDASRPKSVTSFILGRTQAGVPDIKDDKKRTTLAAISTPSKKFVEVKTTNAQHDLVVLHVAYILQKSSNLQSLILEIVRLSKKHDVRESSIAVSCKPD